MTFIRLNLHFFAQKKGGGSAATNCNHDSKSKRLGLKATDGEKVKSGNILIRQRGTKWESGVGTSLGKDYTIYARQEGIVKFYKKKNKTLVSVLNFKN